MRLSILLLTLSPFFTATVFGERLCCIFFCICSNGGGDVSGTAGLCVREVLPSFVRRKYALADTVHDDESNVHFFSEIPDISTLGVNHVLAASENNDGVYDTLISKGSNVTQEIPQTVRVPKC